MQAPLFLPILSPACLACSNPALDGDLIRRAKESIYKKLQAAMAGRPACLAGFESQIESLLAGPTNKNYCSSYWWRQCGQVENLARYIIRACFSQERMTPYHVRGRLYIPEESKVVYQSKDGNEEKIFDALEWLAATRLPRLLQIRRIWLL